MTSITTTGTSCRPAFWEANHLRSPAIISYFPSKVLLGLTIIGCITPCSLIELVNSSKLSLLKFFLGWNLFLIIELIDILFFIGFESTSPINEDSPLPFLNYSATVQLLENEDNTTTVEWTGTFEPRGIEESQAKTIALNMYTNAINGARLELESN